MINIFTLYERFLGRVNTHQGGHARPVRNFENWVNDISMELFEAYYKVFEKSNHISDNLTPFLRSANVLVKPQPGAFYDLVLKPKDYERWGTMRVIRRGESVCGLDGCATLNCEGNYIDADEAAFERARIDADTKEWPIDKIDNARWAALAARRTKKATENSPKCTQFDGGFKLAPKGLPVVVMDFFRLPVTAKFNYTIINAGGEDETIQYVATGSVHLDWPQSAMPEFLTRLELAYGGFQPNSAVLQKGAMDRQEVQ